MQVLEVLTAAVVIVGGIAFIVRTVRRRDRWGVNVRQIVCPKCGSVFPRVRKPANLRQAMWGGSVCASCGTEVDKWGNPV
jgi:hypothetical protein